MSAPLFSVALLWLAGLLLGERLGLDARQWVAGAALALSVGLAAARHSPARGPLLFHPPVYATLLALGLLLGGARGSTLRAHFDAGHLARYNDQGSVAVRGTVARYPEVRGADTRYEIEARAVRPAEAAPWHPAQGRLLVTLPRYPAYGYGDLLELEGELQTPPTFEGFDYRAFLAHRGIFSVLWRGRATRLASHQGAPLFHYLFALRHRAEQTLHLILPEPHASLLGGILLGIESGIPDSVMAAFNATGTTHVLVISGSNFAVLATLFLLLGRRLLGERAGSLLALGGIGLYALFVGGDPPVLRAAIMGGFAVVALLLGRQSIALNTLALAVLAMTALQPGTVHDVGFQLSALATLGLILFVPPLSALTDRLLDRLSLAPTHRRRALALLGDALLITVAAQLITTPLIVGTFGRFSLISLLSNLLIVPVQGWLMVSGGLATLVGMLWLPLGKLLAWLPYAGIGWTLAVVRGSASLPYASIQLGPFPTWFIWWMYGLAGSWWYLDARFRLPAPLPPAPPDVPAPAIERRRWLPWGGALLFALLPLWLSSHLPDGRLHLFALDVGQGDALLLVTPDGRQILVDGGPDPVPLLAALGDRMPPWDRTVELLVLTHPDADHLGGLPEMLHRYGVRQVLDSGQPHPTTLYRTWEERLRARALQPLPARPGQLWQLGGGATLEVLAPFGTPFEGPNNNAVVLRLRYGSFCALLTGDIESEAESRLAQADTLGRCGVLKVAHHGSQTSSTAPFLDRVRPRLALLSLGADNRFGHPHDEVVARLAAMGTRILRTDQQGTIHLATDGTQLWIETER